MAITSATDTLTELVLEVFRLNGRMIASGDSLVAEIGLTSARWQVLGAIALHAGPAPVVRIADKMGLTRQSVQRIVDALEQKGLVAFRTNPHHKRAQLVALTARGTALLQSAMRLQKPWAARLAAGIDARSLQVALSVLTTLRHRLEGQGNLENDHDHHVSRTGNRGRLHRRRRLRQLGRTAGAVGA
jgi:DNA-binding MarR family transcriptional regulator